MAAGGMGRGKNVNKTLPRIAQVVYACPYSNKLWEEYCTWKDTRRPSTLLFRPGLGPVLSHQTTRLQPRETCQLSVTFSPRGVVETPDSRLAAGVTAQVVGKLGYAEDGHSSTAPCADVGVHRDGTAARGCPILIFSYRWWCGVGKYQPGPLDRQTPYRIAISISTAACDVEVLANEEGEGGREGEAGISVDDAIDAGSGNWKRWRGSSPHLDLPHHNTRPSSI